MVPFNNVEVGDPAESGGADIDVGLGLDLPGAADDRTQVLSNNLSGYNFGVTRLGPYNCEGYDSDRDNYDSSND